MLGYDSTSGQKVALKRIPKGNNVTRVKNEIKANMMISTAGKGFCKFHGYYEDASEWVGDTSTTRQKLIILGTRLRPYKRCRPVFFLRGQKI